MFELIELEEHWKAKGKQKLERGRKTMIELTISLTFESKKASAPPA